MMETAFLHSALLGALAGSVVGAAAGVSRVFRWLAIVLPACYLLLHAGSSRGFQGLVSSWGSGLSSNGAFWLGIACGLAVGYSFGRNATARPP